jgi:hypothetical protein
MLLLLLACSPVSPATSPAAPATSVASAPERTDACQRDIPDCEAACALRETNRTEHLEWFDRRCAAVVLGKNPDRAVGYVVPEPVDVPSGPATAATDVPAPATSSTSGMGVPLPSTRQLPPPPTLDPFASRGGATDPVECKAARAMRAKGKTREADVLGALCAAKGGSEARDPKEMDLGF